MTEAEIVLEQSGHRAGLVAAKNFAALCVSADTKRLLAWLAIVAINLEIAKAAMRAKGSSDQAIIIWERACLSVIWSCVEAELGKLKARAIFAAAGLSTAGIDDGQMADPPKPKQPPNLRLVEKD